MKTVDEIMAMASRYALRVAMNGHAEAKEALRNAIEAALKERDAKIAKLERQLADTHLLLGDALDCIGELPEKNCSCHISPPCNDCLENAHPREVLANIRATLKAMEQP